MKENKCCLLLILLLFTYFNALSQKKKTFWDSVKDIANASGISGRVINGDWGELGAGGVNPILTPRNHKYTFDVAGENSIITFSINTTNQTRAYIYSAYGQLIGTVIPNYNKTIKNVRKGKYFIALYADRNSTGTYRIETEGVTNIKLTTPEYFKLDGLNFGDEGSGDNYNNIQSPRNHKFIFEPQTDIRYDINVSSSDGLPVDFVLVEPSGKIVRSKSISNTPGIKYLISQSSLKGDYTIYVSGTKAGSRGSYKIEILGDLSKTPRKIEHNYKLIKGNFAKGGDTHEYIIPLKSSTPLEVLYRSTSVNISGLELQDEYSKTIRPDWRSNPTEQYKNETFKVENGGNYKLNFKSQSSGAYELLIWGDFDEIKQEQSASTTKVVSVNNSGNLIKTSGEIRSAKASVDYSSVKVQAHDYDTGEKKSEVSPDKSGKYILELEPGKKYSITVLSDGKYLASTENVDLTSAKTGETKVAAPIQLLGGDDIGKKLTLNNIFFDTGSPILLRQSYAELKRAASFLKANPHLKIEVAGHTDSVGDDASNLSLSQNRANAVLYYLQDQLDDFSRLSAKGYGKNDPVANNSSEEGRRQNRRVELKIK